MAVPSGACIVAVRVRSLPTMAVAGGGLQYHAISVDELDIVDITVVEAGQIRRRAVAEVAGVGGDAGFGEVLPGRGAHVKDAVVPLADGVVADVAERMNAQVVLVADVFAGGTGEIAKIRPSRAVHVDRTRIGRRIGREVLVEF